MYATAGKHATLPRRRLLAGLPARGASPYPTGRITGIRSFRAREK